MNSEGKIAILLNGPPRAGKDTAINALIASLGRGAAEIIKFTQPVKDLTHRRLGLECAHDAFEIDKDVPLESFGWKTPRESYIETSGRLKAERGDDAVIKLFIDAIAASRSDYILNPDVGDDAEAEGVAASLGADRVLVIRVHKPGHDFRNDCRTWVMSPMLKIVDVHNQPGEIRVYESEIVARVRSFIGDVRSRMPTKFVA